MRLEESIDRFEGGAAAIEELHPAGRHARRGGAASGADGLPASRAAGDYVGVTTQRRRLASNCGLSQSPERFVVCSGTGDERGSR